MGVWAQLASIPNDGPGKSADARVKSKEYSLVAPYVTEDNDRWSIGGSTSVEENLVRLTSNQPYNIGMLYARTPVVLTDWEVVLF